MRWMKRIKIFLLILIGIVTLFSAFLFLSGNDHLFKGLANTYFIGRTGPAIDEHKIFANRTIASGEHDPWLISKRLNEYEIPADILTGMEEYDPVAFLIIRKDSIVLEKYWEGYSESSLSNSFSMAKTFVGILTLKAINDGYIENVDQKVSEFLPGFDEGMNSELTIRHLLSMSSGMNFDESYGDPFGFMAKAYYGDELYKKTMEYEVVEEPGQTFKYLGGNTILLSLIIAKATGKTLSEFCSESLWKPIGAGHDALWNLDDEGGIEKAYCCYYSNARDFARIGKLFMQKGDWNGNQIIDTALVEQSLQHLNLKKEKVDYYGWHWWTGIYDGGPFFYARGILGQYVITIPEKELIIVRLGHRRSKEKIGNHIKDAFDYQDLALDLDEFLSN